MPSARVRNNGAAGCPATVASIAGSASGVRVEVRITFPTYLVGEGADIDESIVEHQAMLALWASVDDPAISAMTVGLVLVLS